MKYGAERSNRDGGISLHARKISFIHPVKKEEITVTAPPPDDALWSFFLSDIEKKKKSSFMENKRLNSLEQKQKLSQQGF